MELSTVANWNQTPEDWRRIIRLSPNGSRCIEVEGKIAATASLLIYSAGMAWIGMVLTRPDKRRQGLARLLMEDVLASAGEQGIRTLKLDATDEGLPLYESLGFVVESTVERWERKAGEIRGDTSRARGNDFGITDDLLAHDEQAFGVSRKRLLGDLARTGGLDAAEEGYVLSRAGRVARYLGPSVATSAEHGRRLIAAHLDTFADARSWYWDLLPANVEAARSAEGFGFTRSRVLYRMRRGESVEHNDALVYAIAGFEFG
jgi:GNAT superfamily N-acetyltransferase